MSTRQLTSANLQILILALLLIVAPFAMCLTPYESIFTETAGRVQFNSYLINPVRTVLIVLGLSLSFVSFILLVRELSEAVNEIIDSHLIQRVILRTSISICSITVGWAALPFWAHGGFQYFFHKYQSVDESFIGDFYPKALMPENWIGVSWSLGVLIFALVLFLSGPILILLNLGFCIKSENWKRDLVSSALLVLSMAFFVWSPNYWACFWD